MAIRDLLVLIDSSAQAAGLYAVSLASTFSAHLTASALVVDPSASLAPAEVPSSFLVAALEEARDATRQLLATFAATAEQAGVSIALEPVQAVLGTTGQALGALARNFDLTVVEQPDPDVPAERDSMIEAALFGSGRPVLIVPYIQAPPVKLDQVLVAWDGSATAARALGDAMPFLERAQRVDLAMVTNAAQDVETARDRITRHLERHDVRSTFHPLTSAGDVASTLLSHAFESGADLMVMGGTGTRASAS